jgi:hypothetical protein
MEWLGVGLLVLQGAGMLAWSTLLWHRFALTSDYSLYHQAWWLIAHGNLNPYSTVAGIPFWRNDLEFVIWPLAVVGLLWSHGPVLLALQDLAIVCGEAVGWHWLCESVRLLPRQPARVLAGVGLVVFLANPWVWWVISFDVHIEVLTAPFAVLAAYDLAHGRQRAWLWVGLTLLGGQVAATWIAGLGIAALLAGRPWRRKGVVLVSIAVVEVVVVAVGHLTVGVAVTQMYGYLGGPGMPNTVTIGALLVGVMTHPGGVVAALWSHRIDVWANLAPTGVVGLANPWAFGLSFPVLLANDLTRGQNFAAPLFQSVLVYLTVPVGTVLVLARLYRRWPRLVLGLGAIVAANAVAWGIAWAPQVASTWLRVPSPAAAVLARAEESIPSGAEVVASQGVAGRFSDRQLIYTLFAPGTTVPLVRRDTWWIVAPAVGIETVPSIDQAALIGELAGPLRAQLVVHGDGVWVFNWVPPKDLRSLTIPMSVGREPAWLAVGPAGAPVLEGPASQWHVSSTQAAGYVVARDYWREPPGQYLVSVRLKATAPVNVELWNATGNLLLARRTVPASPILQTMTFRADSVRVFPAHSVTGWGPFQAQFVTPVGGNRLEVRVWEPTGARVEVATIQILRVP